MKRLMLSLLIISALASLSAALAADKPVVDPWKQHVDVDFKNAPLTNAIAVLFQGSNISYTISPDLNQAVVTAKLVNLPRETALRTIVAAAGATARTENGTVVISAPSDLPRGGGGGRAKPTANIPIDAEVQIFNLRYVDAGRIIPLIAADSQVQVIQSSEKSILAKGGKEALRRLAGTIIMLDTPSALPRAVKIQLKIAVTTSKEGEQPKTAGNFTTLSIGAEGVPQPLEIRVDGQPKPGKDPSGAPIYVNGDSLSASVALTPTIMSDGGKDTISLVGTGNIQGYIQVSFSKPFDVAASVTPGRATEIAAGSGQFGDSSVEFRITALATIEGRVKLPFAKDEESSDPIKVIKARQAVEEAKILYGKAKADLDDAQQRFKSGLCPEADVRAAETAYNLAQIRLNAAEQTLDALKQKSDGW